MGGEGSGDRVEADAGIRPRPPEAYGGRRLPAGHLPRRTAGLDAGQVCAAGAVLRFSLGSAPQLRRPRNDRPADNGRHGK